MTEPSLTERARQALAAAQAGNPDHALLRDLSAQLLQLAQEIANDAERADDARSWRAGRARADEVRWLATDLANAAATPTH